MLRRMKRRSIKKRKWFERINCTEKNKELARKGQESAAVHCEQWVDEAVFHYEQHVEDLHYMGTDNEGHVCWDSEEGNGTSSEGDHCDDFKAAENIPS